MPSRYLRRVAAAAAVLSSLAAAWLPNGRPSVMDSPRSGAVRGTVRFTGSVPVAQPIDMSADAYCAKAHGSAAPPSDRALTVDEGGGIRDVIVYVKQGPSSAKSAPP